MDFALRLESDHDEIRAVLDELEAETSPEKSASLCMALGERMGPHLRAEEQSLRTLPEHLADERVRSQTLKSIELNLILQSGLEGLLSTALEGDGVFEARVGLLQTLFDLHVDELEEELLPRLKKELPKQVWQELYSKLITFGSK